MVDNGSAKYERYPKRYVTVDQASDILPKLKSAGIATSIHYTALKRASRQGLDEIIKALTLINAVPDFVQINLFEPDRSQLDNLRARHIGVVLQLQLSILEKKGFDLLEYVGNYAYSIDGILIDPSLGASIPLDFKKTVKQISMIKNKFPRLAIGMAGGLNDLNVKDTVRAITAELPQSEFNIDAESGLRDEPGECCQQCRLRPVFAQRCSHLQRHFGSGLSAIRRSISQLFLQHECLDH